MSYFKFCYPQLLTILNICSKYILIDGSLVPCVLGKGQKAGDAAESLSSSHLVSAFQT